MPLKDAVRAVLASADVPGVTGAGWAASTARADHGGALRAGFLIERPVEPRPSRRPAFLRLDKHDELCREPVGSLALRALRRD